MWIGVALAVLLSLGIGITLAVLSGSLPHRRQELLETVIGLFAVVGDPLHLGAPLGPGLRGRSLPGRWS